MNSLFPSLKTCLLTGLVPALLLAAAPPLEATGGWNSINLLNDHEHAAISSPEFWIELELKDMAKAYPVKEKYVPTPEKEEEEAAPPEPEAEAGKPAAEPAAAPEEAPKEQKPAKAEPPATEEETLYRKGAEAYHAGNWDAAREAWTALMALPPEKRRERSVSGIYMTGMTLIRAKTPDEAPACFAKVRELTAEGYPDSEGLAAASYGWEAFVWKEKDAEKAIELYLKQLATGDLRAVISIKHVVRRHFFPETYVDYSEVEDGASPPVLPPADAATWEKAAQSPLLRQVITRWNLAMGQDVNSRWSGEKSAEPDPWLVLMEKTGPKAEEADRLAWLAYRHGDYEGAARWLKLTPADTRLSLWLTSKMALRAGDVAKADASLAKAQALSAKSEVLEVTSIDYGPLPPTSAAHGDRGVIQLGQGKFTDALTSFIQAGCWEDAAYIVERVLTLDELTAYVKKNYPRPAFLEEKMLSREMLGRVVQIPETDDKPDPAAEKLTDAEVAQVNETGVRFVLVSQVNGVSIPPDSAIYRNSVAWRLRWVLARRMVREDREAAARPYFPKEIQPLLDAYLEALKKARDKKTPNPEKARNWWVAAWIARHGGMELMGTETSPDFAWFDYGGGETDPLSVRRSGMVTDGPSDEEGAEPSRHKAIFSLPPTAEEKKRLTRHKLTYEKRFHYRWVAAALAKKAAGLLKDGTEEKADVLNQAGSWMFDKDEKAEEAFFFEIKRTCPNTQIGKAVLEKKHTLDLSGPWSGEKPAE